MAERYKFPVGNTVGVASNIFRTPEQIKASEDKIKAALKYLLQGMSKAEAQRQVIEDFKLDVTKNFFEVNVLLFNDMTNLEHVSIIENKDKPLIEALSKSNE